MSEATYLLRYFFDPGSGTCLWSANDAAQERYDYPVWIDRLPVPQETRDRVMAIVDWYDRGLDWNDPAGPSPWDRAEEMRFAAAAQELLAVLRRELGEDYLIRDESRTEQGSPS
jgi:hypothetical protein